MVWTFYDTYCDNETQPGSASTEITLHVLVEVNREALNDKEKFPSSGRISIADAETVATLSRAIKDEFRQILEYKYNIKATPSREVITREGSIIAGVLLSVGVHVAKYAIARYIKRNFPNMEKDLQELVKKYLGEFGAAAVNARIDISYPFGSLWGFDFSAGLGSVPWPIALIFGGLLIGGASIYQGIFSEMQGSASMGKSDREPVRDQCLHCEEQPCANPAFHRVTYENRRPWGNCE